MRDRANPSHGKKKLRVPGSQAKTEPKIGDKVQSKATKMLTFDILVKILGKLTQAPQQESNLSKYLLNNDAVACYNIIKRRLGEFKAHVRDDGLGHLSVGDDPSKLEKFLTKDPGLDKPTRNGVISFAKGMK